VRKPIPVPTNPSEADQSLALASTLDLREQLHRLELALDSSGVVEWERVMPSGHVNHCERWATFLGYVPTDPQWNVSTWRGLVHPDDWPVVKQVNKAYLSGEMAKYECEYRMRHKDGRWIWVLSRGTFMDITERRDAQQALLESEARFRSLTELSADWYWEQDEHFRFVRVDGEIEKAMGLVKEDHIGQTRWEIHAEGASKPQWDAHRKTVYAHQTFHNFELHLLNANGRMNWVSISGVPIFDEQAVFRGYRGIGRNISEQKRIEDETQRLAFYDTLTGLPNRRLLLDRLALAIVNSGRSKQHGALLFIDLDNFKDLNDTLGHDIGDQLLEKVANRLVTCIRQGDTVARLGGDEFVVMLEDLSTSMDEAVTQTEGVGEKVLAALNQSYELAGREHYSTPSIGITLFSGDDQGVDDLLKRADLAMYQAKAEGRNTLCFFDPKMQAIVAMRAALEMDLREGLQNGELLLHYQRVVDAQGDIVGAEALARWQHPRRGMVLPLEFIPLAEQTGLIVPLGDWVLRTACEQLVAWAEQPATAHLSLAVNVSARQFRQIDFVDRVLDILEQTGVRPDLLKLELTESMLLNDVEDIIVKMGALKARGVGFSLDDFGTGYSSLSYLTRLPLDQLKIDKSFVRDVLFDPNDAAIARTVVALAHSLGLSVVAEGVENAGQLAFLISSGCKTFQGYLFGKPGPAHEFGTGRPPERPESTEAQI
jgi:diguanylate cyclase (GGDEF)-like protein/PAS domain S-box-containing protein